MSDTQTTPTPVPVTRISCYGCNSVFAVPEGVTLDENLCPRCDAFKALLAACEGLEQTLLPYRGTDCGPDRTYLCSRQAIASIRAAIAKACLASQEPKRRTAMMKEFCGWCDKQPEPPHKTLRHSHAYPAERGDKGSWVVNVAFTRNNTEAKVCAACARKLISRISTILEATPASTEPHPADD